MEEFLEIFKLSPKSILARNKKVYDFSEKLELIENIFWKEGTCGINLKVQTNESEAIIELGDEYKFKPTLENLFYLEEIFGKDVIQI